MDKPVLQRSLWFRLLRGAFALGCAAMLLLGSTANAGTILAFGQSNPVDIITATASGTTTTLSSTGNADGGGTSLPVLASNYLGVPFPLGLPMFETLTATSTSAATINGSGTISQDFSGTIEFTSLPGGAGAIYLSATFTDAVFSGKGASASLNATYPDLSITVPGITYGSNQGMSIAFSGITPSLSINGSGTVAGFTAQNAGTFSGTVVPEPSTFCLASCAIAVCALVYGRKKITKRG